MGTKAFVVEATHLVDSLSHERNCRELDAVLSRSLPSLHRRAFRYLENSADAEDAVQEALLSAYKHLGQFRGQAQMSTWLTTIVTNAAFTQLRKRVRSAHVSLNHQPNEGEGSRLCDRLPTCEADPEEVFSRSQLLDRLAVVIRLLSPSLRVTFQLRHIDGLSIRETARILGLTEGAVKARSHRAHAKIIVLMQKGIGSPQQRTAESRSFSTSSSKAVEAAVAARESRKTIVTQFQEKKAPPRGRTTLVS